MLKLFMPLYYSMWENKIFSVLPSNFCNWTCNYYHIKSNIESKQWKDILIKAHILINGLLVVRNIGIFFSDIAAIFMYKNFCHITETPTQLSSDYLKLCTGFFSQWQKCPHFLIIHSTFSIMFTNYLCRYVLAPCVSKGGYQFNLYS